MTSIVGVPLGSSGWTVVISEFELEFLSVARILTISKFALRLLLIFPGWRPEVVDNDEEDEDEARATVNLVMGVALM